MTIYLVDLEAVETRYTAQWKNYVPKIIQEQGHQIYIISGPEDIPSATTPGAFLNFGGTNIYKSRQVEEIARLFTAGSIMAGDHFVFYDAWHPGIINLKYMSELLGIQVKTHGLWHSGSYDPQDFLGRLIGPKKWVQNAERSFFSAFDFNYFATNFHIEMFVCNLLNDGLNENPWLNEDLDDAINNRWASIVRTGWPMKYLPEILSQYKGMKKRDLILFPHRIAPEKQLDIFMDLSPLLPQYEFVVCQEKQLTKHEYHTLLGQAKIVFSANLQETLGISCYEGAVVDAVPMVPDRLSYKEMYYEEFKYPNHWTENFDSYMKHRAELVHHIIVTMTHYEKHLSRLQKQTEELNERFFSCQPLLNNLC
jgi:glycosyltransferase involved in cell wall biosynthesis